MDCTFERRSWNHSWAAASRFAKMRAPWLAACVLSLTAWASGALAAMYYVDAHHPNASDGGPSERAWIGRQHHRRGAYDLS